MNIVSQHTWIRRTLSSSASSASSFLEGGGFLALGAIGGRLVAAASHRGQLHENIALVTTKTSPDDHCYELTISPPDRTRRFCSLNINREHSHRMKIEMVSWLRA